MARSKNSGTDSEYNAKIKAVYFEAENVHGDLSAIIKEFANAIRTAPVHVVPHRSQAPKLEGELGNGTGQTALVVEEEVDDASETAPATTVTGKPVRERKSFKGVILDDIDWDGGGTSFSDYMKQKNPPDTMKKYLVIVAWYKRRT